MPLPDVLLQGRGISATSAQPPATGAGCAPARCIAPRHLAHLTDEDQLPGARSGKVVSTCAAAANGCVCPAAAWRSETGNPGDVVNQDERRHETFRAHLRRGPISAGAGAHDDGNLPWPPAAFEAKLRFSSDRLIEGRASGRPLPRRQDRTGFASAMLLLALDVPLEAVFDDTWPPCAIWTRCVLPEALKPVLAEMLDMLTPLAPRGAEGNPYVGAPRRYLQTAPDAIVQHYRSTDVSWKKPPASRRRGTPRAVLYNNRIAAADPCRTAQRPPAGGGGHYLDGPLLVLATGAGSGARPASSRRRSPG